MSFPLVILAGKGKGREEDETLERPDGYAPDGLGHVYKFAELVLDGKPLGERALAAYTSCKERNGRGSVFNPIYIAGPASLHAHFKKELKSYRVALIDTDGELHENISAVSRYLLSAHPHALSLIAAGDLLPSNEDVDGLVDLLREHESTADIIYPLASRDAVQKAGFTKRTYTVIDHDGESVPYHFGQVYALRPSQVRWDLICQGAKYNYARRAKGFKQHFKYWELAKLLFGTLLKPRNIRAAPFIARHLPQYLSMISKGDLSLDDGEKVLNGIILYNDPRRKRERRTVLEVTPYATLALDIDTLTEKTATEKRLLEERV